MGAALKYLFLFAALFLQTATCLGAGDLCLLEDRGVRIFHEAPLAASARQAAERYPVVAASLKQIFGWEPPATPSLFLVTRRGLFRQMAQYPLAVAFAVPARKVMVIDVSRTERSPFSMENTLKHELCHLLLHEHIQDRLLPRWLDEGVCQWASNGIGEVLIDPKRSRLNRAAFRDDFIPLFALRACFPHDAEALLLAYEESLSVVRHIIGRYGREGLLKLLKRMKAGADADEASMAALSLPLDRLEREWHQSLRQQVTWFTYVSYHLYEILFALMAVITLAAFVKVILRKRAYLREEREKGLDL